MLNDILRCPDCELELFAPNIECPRCGGSQHGPEVASEAGDLSSVLTPDRRFRVLDTLGRGGMGIVYKVHDRELDEIIALKVLDPLFGDHDDAVRRFKHELKIARRINHPNVARLYDLCAWHGRLALSQEFIPGKDLNSVLEAGPLQLDVAVRYMRYLCSALVAAHALGVVHRDLKPANVMVDGRDRPRILDFGIAVLAGAPLEESPDSVFGTPWYMSPEQAYYPEDVDHRSDIYSLGIVLYRMLTGRVPFGGHDAQLVFEAHLQANPPRPSSIRPELTVIDGAILRSLAKKPEDRFQSARDFYEALAALVERGAPASESAPVTRPAPRVLVIDDDTLTRRIVGDMLSEIGAEVIEATNGYEGVEKALATLPDFVLLDLVMPVLDGREALRILKHNPATSHVPVVMLTSLDDPEEAMFSKEQGAAAYLNKPVQEDVLELLIEKFTGL